MIAVINVFVVVTKYAKPNALVMIFVHEMGNIDLGTTITHLCLNWWKEFDTYKVGTVANSCSTMHKISEKEFNRSDFSHEHIPKNPNFYSDTWDTEKANMFFPVTIQDVVHFSSDNILDFTIQALNYYREKYIETKDKKYWWQLIQLLPSSYNQTRNAMLNYEVLANIYKSRQNHKLDEWQDFCDWIETLPYSDLITRKETK